MERCERRQSTPRVPSGQLLRIEKESRFGATEANVGLREHIHV